MDVFFTSSFATGEKLDLGAAGCAERARVRNPDLRDVGRHVFDNIGNASAEIDQTRDFGRHVSDIIGHVSAKTANIWISRAGGFGIQLSGL